MWHFNHLNSILANSLLLPAWESPVMELPQWPRPWVFSYKIDCCKELVFCSSFNLPSPFIYSRGLILQPSLFSCSLPRELSLMTSLSAIPGSFLSLYLLVHLPKEHHTLHLAQPWNEHIETTHYINSSSKSHYSSHVAILIMAGCIYKLLFLPHPPQLTIPIRCSSKVAPLSA